jgi:uncharacterized metal-binding protein YceD (DUF177 family)
VKIQVDSIGPDGLELNEPLAVSWLNGLLGGAADPTDPAPASASSSSALGGVDFLAAAPGHMQAKLIRADDRTVVFSGSMSVRLEGPCSRCLGAVPYQVDVPLQLTYVPPTHEPVAGEDGELRDDDLGVAVYQGREIDLGSLVRDELLLQLPMQPLCAASCAGLCPSCGANRNQAPCSCEAPIDPRLGPLRSIRLP